MLGMFTVAKQPAAILFDSGASHTFISRTFATKHEIPIQTMKKGFCIQSPGGRVDTTETVCQIPIEIGGYIFPTNLIVLQGQDIDVIIGMNWMQKRGVLLDTFNRTVKLKVPGKNSELIIGLPTPTRVTERICATSLKEIQDVPVVCEFPDVFPDDLPCLPPDRDVQFSIELKPGTAPISRRAYRIPPLHLAELKKQLQELLDKGFI